MLDAVVRAVLDERDRSHRRNESTRKTLRTRPNKVRDSLILAIWTHAFRRTWTSFVSADGLPPMPKPAMPQHPSLYPERFDLIDAFRGLAALAVVIHHVIGATIPGFRLATPR